MSIPIIGQTKAAPTQPTIEDLDEETKARLAAMAEEHPEDVDDAVDVQTAFFVIQHHDGAWQVVSDVTTRLAPDRVATAHDILAGTAVVAADVQIETTSRATVGMMMAATQQMSQRMQEQQMAAQLAGKNLRA